MKYALNGKDEIVEAGPNAPAAGTCPECGFGVTLRSRRIDREGNKTWYYRHRRGAPDNCILRGGPPGLIRTFRHDESTADSKLAEPLLYS